MHDAEVNNGGTSGPRSKTVTTSFIWETILESNKSLTLDNLDHWCKSPPPP